MACRIHCHCNVGVGVTHGTACKLEGIPSTLPRVLSDALYPATSDREKVSFHQINKQTGNRVRMQRVDEATHEPVDFANIVKGYEVAKGSYLEVTDEELEAIAVESKRTIDIDEFVPKEEIDQLYNVRPYYIAPDGNSGTDAFVVIRDIITSSGTWARWRLAASCSPTGSTSLRWSPATRVSWERCCGIRTRCATRRSISRKFRT